MSKRNEGLFSVPLIDVEVFNERFEIFKKLDHKTHPYCFKEFWKWKLHTENTVEHILNGNNRKETFRRLGLTLKKWLWYRPRKYYDVAERLRRALRNISGRYDELRGYSFLELTDIPKEILEDLWCTLASVKEEEGKDPSSRYLIMPITKPLMFLWGQTLAFDSVVRKYMPKLNAVGKSYDRWTFKNWIKALSEIQEELKKQPDVIKLFQKISREEYGQGLVPYGQFLDLYYWCAKPRCIES